jgi:hypothetical protein
MLCLRPRRGREFDIACDNEMTVSISDNAKDASGDVGLITQTVARHVAAENAWVYGDGGQLGPQAASDDLPKIANVACSGAQRENGCSDT